MALLCRGLQVHVHLRTTALSSSWRYFGDYPLIVWVIELLIHMQRAVYMLSTVWHFALIFTLHKLSQAHLFGESDVVLVMQFVTLSRCNESTHCFVAVFTLLYLHGRKWIRAPNLGPTISPRASSCVPTTAMYHP